MKFNLRWIKKKICQSLSTFGSEKKITSKWDDIRKKPSTQFNIKIYLLCMRSESKKTANSKMIQNEFISPLKSSKQDNMTYKILLKDEWTEWNDVFPISILIFSTCQIEWDVEQQEEVKRVRKIMSEVI